MMTPLVVSTSRAIEAIDITERIAAERWPDGFAWLNCPHTTAALLIGESDPDMLEDYERVAAELFAPYEPFRHHRNDNPNGAAHLVSSFVGTQLLLRVQNGRLQLGTFQRVIFLELDGPKATRLVQLESLPVVAPTNTIVS